MMIAALLTTALLFGGMVLYSFGFAAFLFTALPAAVAGRALRQAFPHFYVFVIVTSTLAAVLVWSSSSLLAAALGLIAATTVPTRQILMPAINAATDAGRKAQFKGLHGTSVVITLSHIALAGWVLSQFLTIAL